MPLRLFPFALAAIMGAVYLLGGFDQSSDNVVGIHESRYAVEDAIVWTLADSKMHDAEDFVIGLTDPFRSAIDLPFN